MDERAADAEVVSIDDLLERVRGPQALLQGVDKGASLGLAAKADHMLVELNLPRAPGFAG